MPTRVLVADSADDSRRPTVSALAGAGFAVTEATTATDALRLAGAVRPQVIVLSDRLPDIPAGEMCRRLRAGPGTSAAPILLLSATGTDAHLALESGAAAWLTTPAAPVEMIALVRTLGRLHEAETALRTRDRLLAIARAVTETADLTEAIRLVCRELTHLTGADSVGAHLLDRERDELLPVAGYHIPKEMVGPIGGNPVSEQPFWPVVLQAGEVIWSDDVAHDERFAFHLFRELPHQSGVVVPLVIDGEVAGTFYLVWLKDRRRLDAAETAMLRTIGQQVGLFLRNARLLEQAEIRDRVAEAAKLALRERETQLRNLGDNLPNGVIYQVVRRADGSNYFPYMSAGLERTFGVSATDVMVDASLVYRLVLPEDLAGIRAAADESIRTGEPIDVEYRMRTPSGGIRWMNLRGRPTPLADGATRWDVVALDVTERKHAEHRLRTLADDLRRSEERYRLLFERSFVGIFRTRADGIVMDCNDAFARILGYGSADEMRGQSVVPHYATPADRETVVARISAGEEVIDAEMTGRRRDGSLVPVAMSVRRVVDAEGAVHEGVLVDLTDRKRAAEAAALRSVAELANAAAHEINNPLTVVGAQLELMRKGGDLDARIERAQKAARRIQDIVSHMLSITRLEPAKDWPPGLPPMLDIRRSGG